MRLAGHYLPLSTIAWGLSLYFLAGNLAFLGGHTGISNVPVIEIFGFAFDNGRRFTYLIWGFVFVCIFLIRRTCLPPARAVRFAASKVVA